MDDVVNRLAATAPTLRDEPQAYCKARIRQGYEAGRREALEQAAAWIECELEYYVSVKASADAIRAMKDEQP